MKFPNLVYKSPGMHQCPGGTFDYLQVRDADETLAAGEEGYYPTIELALKKPKVVDWEFELPVENSKDEDPQDPQDPPTREELEAKAKELKIKFNKSTKDSELFDQIVVALDKLED